MATNVVFEILYKEYYVRVYGLCRRLLNSTSQAEDATQETFMRAYRQFKRYKQDQPFWHWIAAIASHYCVDLLRQRSRTPQFFGGEAQELDLVESADVGVLDTLIEAEDAGAVNAAIASLDDKYRVPLVLAYFNESSYDEIAKTLSISRNHVGVLLLRAKQQLRTTLGQDPGGDA
ncbi:MAG: sigma-70 family RNA polymerase sigma factor [Pseudomonadales bacterium]|nr:sigma-70 family RNA polymerase sigma factor [Pseudomonadales bacterium]